MHTSHKSTRVHQRGVVVIEMALLLPILIFLMIAVVELSQALQANNIVVNIAREGANLTSRRSGDSNQEIMKGLSLSATPLDMQTDGIIFLTVVAGGTDGLPVVLEQHRYVNGKYEKQSRIWPGCTSWQPDGSCLISSSRRPILNSFIMNLDVGESTNVVEVYYRHDPLMNLILDEDLSIYSRALM